MLRQVLSSPPPPSELPRQEPDFSYLFNSNYLNKIEEILLKFSTNLSAKLGTLTASTISMKTSESPLFHKDHFQDFNRATKVYANLFFLTRKIFALDSATSNRGKGVALNHKAVRTYIERLKEEADEPTTPCSTGAETDTEEDLFVVGEFDEDLSSTNTADEPSTETDSPKRASPHPAGPNQHFSKFLENLLTEMPETVIDDSLLKFEIKYLNSSERSLTFYPFDIESFLGKGNLDSIPPFLAEKTHKLTPLFDEAWKSLSEMWHLFNPPVEDTSLIGSFSSAF